MIPANFDYESPRDLNEALALIASRQDARALAGGHSLLPAMKLRLAAPALLIDLSRVPGLDYIRQDGARVRIGAMSTHAAIASSALLRGASPLLGQTAIRIGDAQVRNRGTIGGALAHADPASDYPAAILALDAEIVAMSTHGERIVAARDFYTGLFTTALAADELITEVRIPVATPAATVYRKFAHPASGFAVAGVAVLLRSRGSVIQSAAIGVTGVAATPYRATAVEEALHDRPAAAIRDAAARAADGIEALGDTFASPQYRCHLARVLTRRALEQCLAPRHK